VSAPGAAVAADPRPPIVRRPATAAAALRHMRTICFSSARTPASRV